MNNEKLMKIVQAVNDSKGEPLGLGATPKSTFISRAKEDSLHATNSIHAVYPHMDDRYWQSICTVEEFKQCVKEMSAGYEQKETKMKDNKHPHHDLIVEWAKDTSKTVQQYCPHGETWFDDNNPTWCVDAEFRFKPREFTKGHWYPCVDRDGEKVCYFYNGSDFYLTGDVSRDEVGYPECGMKWIGESLGEINFG